MKRMNRTIFCCMLGFAVLLGLAVLVGCHLFKEEKSAQKYNAVLQNSKFIQALEKYKILLIAPGSGTAPEKIFFLKEIHDLNIIVPENVLTEAIAFHANSDEGRFEALKSALNTNNPTTLLWSLRGGYGSARLIEHLKKMPKPKTQKIVIGYSDMTALHLFLSQKWGWKTIHGAMLIDLLNDKKDPLNFQKIADLLTNSDTLTQKNVQIEINNLQPLNESARKLLSTQGVLTGGNLTMVQTSIGTNWEIITKNKILFFEDEGEKGYRIDRALHQLKQAGLLDGVKAIVFGEFTATDEFAPLALQRFAQETQIPIFKTDEFGHGVKNYPLIYNAKSKIEKSKDGSNYDLIMQLD